MWNDIAQEMNSEQSEYRKFQRKPAVSRSSANRYLSEEEIKEIVNTNMQHTYMPVDYLEEELKETEPYEDIEKPSLYDDMFDE